MTKLAQASADRVIPAGPLQRIPNVLDEDVNGDQPIFTATFTPLAATTTTTKTAADTKMIPFDYKIIGVHYAATGITATNGSLNVGTVADNDHFLDDFDIGGTAANKSAGLHSVPQATLVTKEGNAGDLLQCDLDNTFDTTAGNIAVTVLYVPR